LLEKLNGLDFEEEELLKFLSEASGKQVFVKEEFEDSIKVSLYEKSKSFLVPLDYFIEEEENTSEIEEKAGFFDTFKKYFDYKINFFLLLFIFV
jgi:hypothetical protein